ncbi:uncharacterized protein [Musca autumnalis]|uniref:uncharacterized protein n=1 Tax=Musca autumnalis TaxID=221902 RepID=UPI003CF99C9C
MNNKRNLDLVCSPGKYKRVASDPEYMNSVLSQMTSKDFDEIVFSSNPEPGVDAVQLGLELASSYSQDETNPQVNSDGDSKKITWLDAIPKFSVEGTRRSDRVSGRNITMYKVWTKLVTVRTSQTNGHG